MVIVEHLRKGVSRNSALARFRRDESGSTILEFAFVAGPFFALLLAILQTAMIFFANQCLDTATQAVARLVMTGVTEAGVKSAGDPGIDKAGFKAAACAQLPTFMRRDNCSNLTVDVQSFSSFSSVNTGAPTITYSGSGVPSMPNNYQRGGPNDYVIVRLAYPWNVVGAPGLDLASMQNGQFLLMATSVTRTEPYK